MNKKRHVKSLEKLNYIVPSGKKVKRCILCRRVIREENKTELCCRCLDLENSRKHKARGENDN